MEVLSIVPSLIKLKPSQNGHVFGSKKKPRVPWNREPAVCYSRGGVMGRF